MKALPKRNTIALFTITSDLRKKKLSGAKALKGSACKRGLRMNFEQIT